MNALQVVYIDTSVVTLGCKQSRCNYVHSVIVWTQIFTTYCSLVTSVPSYISIFKSQLPTSVPPFDLVVWEGLLIWRCSFILLVEPRHSSQSHPAALWSWVSDLLRTEASVCPTNFLMKLVHSISAHRRSSSTCPESTTVPRRDQLLSVWSGSSLQSVSAGPGQVLWDFRRAEPSRPRQGRNSRLVKVVVVVVVFMMMVMLVPLHHLCQPTFIQHHTGEVSHLFLLHWTWRHKRAQSPVAMAVFRSLFVFAVGRCRLMGWDLTGKSWGRGSTSAPHHPTTGLRWRRAAVGLRRTDGVSPWVLAFEVGGMEGGVWSSRFNDGLQTTVVGVGLSIFWFMGARPSLVRWAGLSLHFNWFCSRSWKIFMDADMYFKQLPTKCCVKY